MNKPTPRTPKSHAFCDIVWANLISALELADWLGATGDERGASDARLDADAMREVHRAL